MADSDFQPRGMPGKQSKPWFSCKTLLALWLFSSLVRVFLPETGRLSPGQDRASMPEWDSGKKTGEMIEFAWFDQGERDGETVILLHGNPGRAQDLMPVADALSEKGFRVLVPDLPGSGASSRVIADYSAKTQARYLEQFFHMQAISSVHVAGFGFGGELAAVLAADYPERVQSLAMVGSVGEEELYLLGDRSLNLSVLGMQRAGIWAARTFLPHFGLLDRLPYNGSFAATCMASNLGRLTKGDKEDGEKAIAGGIFQNLQLPVFVLHGKSDGKINVATAMESARLIPQAELVLLPGKNPLEQRQSALVASKLQGFLNAVNSGDAPTRATASDERKLAAMSPFSRKNYQEQLQERIWVFIILIAIATLVSEDIVCVGAGLLAAAGVIPFWAAVLGCCLGIYVGDVSLFLLGRWFGAPAIHKAPLKWMIRPREVAAAKKFFDRFGALIIVGTRWLPGLRIPIFCTAGIIKRSFLWFSGWMIVGAILWTPVLVGASMKLGEQIKPWVERFEEYAALLILGLMLFLVVSIKVVMALSSHSGRRGIIGWWRRVTRWEFWPMWLFYPPVVLHIVRRGIKHRHLALFTAANPGIAHSGFIHESKSAILLGFQGHPAIAKFDVIPGEILATDQMIHARSVMAALELDFPVVLKPDLGERGRAVEIIRDESAMADYFARSGTETIILQEYVAGEEFGVFYLRHPDESTGRIFSIAEKQLTAVVGNGADNLERLILDDERAVCMAPFFLKTHDSRLDEIPKNGEKVLLTELGTHCRGAKFLDANELITPELTQTIDEISKCFQGFHIGRFDLRVPSKEAFQKGEGIRILELNGVTSEAAHIYQPGTSLIKAWQTLFTQWDYAIEFGAANRSKGYNPTSFFSLMKLVLTSRAKLISRAS